MAISFRQIEVFRCVMTAGTTTRAAEELLISQPAVSRHISGLEEHLGFELFKRIRGRLEPTTAAVEFARSVDQNFLGMERIEHAARNIREGVPQPVAVACLPALSTSLIPIAARYLAGSRRGPNVFIDTCTVAETIEKLQNLSVDMAVTLTFPTILGIEAEPVFSVDHVCAIPEGHRLAGKECITPEDFSGETVVGWGAAGPLSFEREKAVFSDIIAGRDITVTTHTSHTRYAMVAAGMGITIAEPFAAEPWIHNGVVLRRFEPALPLSYSLCYPTGRLRSERVGLVRNALISAVAEWNERHKVLNGVLTVEA